MSKARNHAEPEPASKLSELKLRLISAAIGLPALGLVLFLGFWSVAIVAVIVTAIVGFETRQLVSGVKQSINAQFFAMLSGGVVAGAGVFAAMLGYLDIDSVIADRTAIAIGFVILILLVEIVAIARLRQIDKIRQNLILSYGAAVALAVTMLPFVVSLEKGREILAFGILVVFAADSGAFFVGRTFGNRKIAPKISPGKTWEGLIGGIVAALIASWALSNLLSLEYSFTKILSMGLAIAVIGIAGDLGESWIKRLSGVKDSGSIIPGHGGIMDRLDALAPNFVFIYFIERWLA